MEKKRADKFFSSLDKPRIEEEEDEEKRILKEQSIDKMRLSFLKTTWRERVRERDEKQKLNLEMKNLLFYGQIYQRKSYFVVNVSINQSVGFKISGFFAASIFFSPSCFFFVEKIPSRDDRMILRWVLGASELNKFFNIFIVLSLPSLSMCLYIMYHQLSGHPFCIQTQRVSLAMAATWCDWAFCARFVWLLVGKFNSDATVENLK